MRNDEAVAVLARAAGLRAECLTNGDEYPDYHGEVGAIADALHVVGFPPDGGLPARPGLRVSARTFNLLVGFLSGERRERFR